MHNRIGMLVGGECGNDIVTANMNWGEGSTGLVNAQMRGGSGDDAVMITFGGSAEAHVGVDLGSGADRAIVAILHNSPVLAADDVRVRGGLGDDDVSVTYSFVATQQPAPGNAAALVNVAGDGG